VGEVECHKATRAHHLKVQRPDLKEGDVLTVKELKDLQRPLAILSLLPRRGFL